VSTVARAAAHHRPFRPRRVPSRVVSVTDQEFAELRDCCCHKLGARRPHLALECADL
jgi:hypothetical protein